MDIHTCIHAKHAFTYSERYVSLSCLKITPMVPWEKNKHICFNNTCTGVGEQFPPFFLLDVYADLYLVW